MSKKTIIRLSCIRLDDRKMEVFQKFVLETVEGPLLAA